MKKAQKTNRAERMPDIDENDNLREYQEYPVSEDIYKRYRKEINIDPEDISREKYSGKNDKGWTNIKEESNEDPSGRNLDIPGSELDDEQENVGNEDEENNYYSIGGDDHNDLDEDKNDF